MSVQILSAASAQEQASVIAKTLREFKDNLSFVVNFDDGGKTVVIVPDSERAIYEERDPRIKGKSLVVIGEAEATALGVLDGMPKNLPKRCSGRESYNKILGRVGYSGMVAGEKPQLSRDDRAQARKEKKRKRRNKK